MIVRCLCQLMTDVDNFLIGDDNDVCGIIVIMK